MPRLLSDYYSFSSSFLCLLPPTCNTPISEGCCYSKTVIGELYINSCVYLVKLCESETIQVHSENISHTSLSDPHCATTTCGGKEKKKFNTMLITSWKKERTALRQIIYPQQSSLPIFLANKSSEFLQNPERVVTALHPVIIKTSHECRSKTTEATRVALFIAVNLSRTPVCFLHTPVTKELRRQACRK